MWLLPVIVFSIVSLWVPNAISHPGGRDSNGGHTDINTSQYHLHEGPLAGQAFSTKKAALAALTAATNTTPPPIRTTEVGETIALASWNVRNISDNSRSDAELGIISLIIFRYDFIAFQGVRDKPVIERIQKILKDDFQVDYGIDVSAEVGHDKKERYAFVWRTDKIGRVTPGAFYSDPGDEFEREPFCGSFKAGDFDWGMCTIHLWFGDDDEDRRHELLLLDDVYRAMRDAGSEKDIILCGDFNFGPDDAGWDQLKAEDQMKFAIPGPEQTTIAEVSHYDNCWWSAATAEVISDSGRVYEFDELMYAPDSRKEASRLTRDHRPIHIRVRIDAGDDD